MTSPEPNRVDLTALASLPPAARRWLDRALPKDRALSTNIHIEQRGEMEIRGRWTPFEATGHYQASPFSFDWRAKLQALPGVWILAEDGHHAGQGWGRARLWGRISLGQRTGPEVYASQLVRHLGELPLLPAFALAIPSQKWSTAGDRNFEVRASAGDQEVMVRFTIDGQGNILRAYSPARPYDVPGGFAVAPWQIVYDEHRDFAGARLPATAVATFDKAEGPWEYFRANLIAVTPDA